MSHVRQQIREAAAAALTGLTTTGARVFQSRIRPLRDADLPCLLVNTDEETIDGATIAGMLERTLTLQIRAVAKVADDLDDTLDTMLAEVEVALATQTLGGRAKNIELTKIEIELNDDLEKPVGIATASYQVSYYTAAGIPGTAI